MSFEWNRIHKWEDNLEQSITESVFEVICEFYRVDDVSELTQEQRDDVEGFRENDLGEYSVMQIGFSNFISYWDDENYEEDS